MPRKNRSPHARFLRFLASVLMVTGALLLVDAGLTFVWQEPISSFFAEREQSRLGDALASPPQRVIERKPLPGDAIGEIALPTQDRSYFVIEGTGTAETCERGPATTATLRCRASAPRWRSRAIARPIWRLFARSTSSIAVIG
jgi:hypothetical protein